MADPFANVPKGKQEGDRLTRGGVTKFWHNPYGKIDPLGVLGGSWQTAATLNAERRKAGLDPKDFSNVGGSPLSPSTPKPYDPTREREELKVVKGGKAGFVSKMPKPTAQTGETAQALQARMSKWEKSQALAKKLTQQLKSKQSSATDNRPQDTSSPPSTPNSNVTGLTGETRGGLPVYNSYEFDLEDLETIDERTFLAPRTSGGVKKWYQVTDPGNGGQRTEIEVSPTTRAIDRFNRLAAAQQTTTRSPASQPPAGTRPPAAPVLPPPSPAGAPKPFGQTMPAPDAASLQKYNINKDWAAANPRLAQAEVKRAEQRAAGKSVFDKEFRKTVINPILYKEQKMSIEPYDLVLEYLLSEGHADTVEEAHYVMMQMSAEHIQDIVEGGPLLPGEPGKAPSSGYKEPVLPGEKRLTPKLKEPAPGASKLPPA